MGIKQNFSWVTTIIAGSTETFFPAFGASSGAVGNFVDQNNGTSTAGSSDLAPANTRAKMGVLRATVVGPTGSVWVLRTHDGSKKLGSGGILTASGSPHTEVGIPVTAAEGLQMIFTCGPVNPATVTVIMEFDK